MGHYWTVIWRPNSIEPVIITHVDNITPEEMQMMAEKNDYDYLLTYCIAAELLPGQALYDEDTQSSGTLGSWKNDIASYGYDLFAVFPGHVQSWI